jgi:hypothetical protein
VKIAYCLLYSAADDAAAMLLQEGFGSLAVSVTGAGGAQEGKDFVRKHQELHGEYVQATYRVPAKGGCSTMPSEAALLAGNCYGS